MRCVFLISAFILHISWCYAFPSYPNGLWMSTFFNPFIGTPNFLDKSKLNDSGTVPVKINGLNDAENKPGAPLTSGSSGTPDGFYTISHSSFVSTLNGDGKVHTEGEAVVNENGKITKFKY